MITNDSPWKYSKSEQNRTILWFWRTSKHSLNVFSLLRSFRLTSLISSIFSNTSNRRSCACPQCSNFPVTFIPITEVYWRFIVYLPFSQHVADEVLPEIPAFHRKGLTNSSSNSYPQCPFVFFSFWVVSMVPWLVVLDVKTDELGESLCVHYESHAMNLMSFIIMLVSQLSPAWNRNLSACKYQLTYPKVIFYSSQFFSLH